jgi:hypothetical protein
MVGARYDAEEHRVGVTHHRPRRDRLRRGRRNAAEEQIRDVALEDDDLAVAGENAGEHADRALQHRDDGQHRRDAEGDARDAEERPDAMPAEIGQDQLEEDHRRLRPAPSQASWASRTRSS